MDAGVATVLAAAIVSIPGVIATAIAIKNQARLTELLRTIAATNQAIGRADQKRDEMSISAGRPPNEPP